MNEVTIKVKATNEAAPAFKGVQEGLKGVEKQADQTDRAIGSVERELLKMDVAIMASKRELSGLALELARTDNAAKKLDLGKAIRSLEKDIATATKTKKNIKLGDMIDVTDAGKLGATVGKDLGSGVVKSASGSLADLGPVVMGVLAVGAVSAAPLIGATIGAAVLGGAGIGGIVGGAMIASKDARVQGAFKGLAETAKSELQHAAEPFVPAMLNAIGIAKQGFIGFNADLKGIFSASAGYVKPLTDGLMGLVREALPGIRKAIESAGPIFAKLGAELPELGAAFGDMFSSISDHAPEAAAALGFILDGLEVLIPVIGDVIGWLSSMFGKMVEGELNIIDMVDKLGTVVPAAALLSKALQGTKERLESASATMHDTSDSSQTLGESMGFVEGEAKKQTEAVQDLKTQLDGMANSSMSVFDAEIEAADAIDKSTKAIAKNGKATSDNSEKGRENNRQLSSLAKSFNSLQDATEASGGSANRVNRIFDSQRAKFIAAAKAAGYTASEATNLANKLLKIPTNRTVTIKGNVGDASTKIQAIKDALNRVPGSKVITIRAFADLPAGLSLGNLLHHASGGVQGAASGGLRSNMTWVGEHGPELVNLPPGAAVNSNPDSMRMAAQGGGGGGGEFILRAAPNAGRDLMAVLIEGLRYEIRTRAGKGSTTVQTVLGTV